mmetsp:Transcript_131/g.301  ORF Transcript_131/g.301 Transcript_131/m.301 type:complete len:81 (+) Transcript_131:254-496(+)
MLLMSVVCAHHNELSVHEVPRISAAKHEGSIFGLTSSFKNRSNHSPHLQSANAAAKGHSQPSRGSTSRSCEQEVDYPSWL